MNHINGSFNLNKGDNQRLELYHLGHDLRGPLNSILGFTELLLDGIEGPLNEYQLADIQAINQSAHNLLRLINNVVDISKLEHNRLGLSFVGVDILDKINRVLQYDYGTAKPNTLNLTANLPPQLPFVHGNPDRIEQMIMGLIYFSFKVPTNQVNVTAYLEDNFVTILFDIGLEFFSPEKCENLFTLGTQLDNAGHSRLNPGGLDLPLVHWLAQVHAGTLQVESSVAEGTQFYLKLPCHTLEE